MSGQRRELGAAVAGLAVAGGLALSSGGQTWATATVTRQAPLPPVAEELTGTDLAPLVPACGLLLLAAAVAVVAVRGRGRQLVGLLACVGGGTLLWSGLRALLDEPGLADLADGTAAAATGLDVSRSAAWPVLAVVAGLLGAVAAGLAVLRGTGWQAMGRRYEREPASGPGRAAAGTREDRALDAWRALDRGEDPTADAEDDAGPSDGVSDGPFDGSAPGGGAPAAPPAGGGRDRL